MYLHLPDCCVIRKLTDTRMHFVGQVINTKQESDGPKTGPCGTPDETGSSVELSQSRITVTLSSPN